MGSIWVSKASSHTHCCLCTLQQYSRNWKAACVCSVSLSKKLNLYLFSNYFSVWSTVCLMCNTNTSYTCTHTRMRARTHTELVTDVVWSDPLRGSGHFNPFHMTVIRQGVHNTLRSVFCHLTHTLPSDPHLPWLSTFHSFISKQLS